MSGAPRLVAGAVAAVALVVSIAMLGLALNGDGTARAEFYAAVDALDELSNAALDDGLITPTEAAALNAQAAVIEQALTEDPDVVAVSSEGATSNAIDVLTDVQARLSERAPKASSGEAPTANAVLVLERVAEKLETAALDGPGRGPENANDRGRGGGNQGQGVGNAPPIRPKTTHRTTTMVPATATATATATAVDHNPAAPSLAQTGQSMTRRATDGT